jgi:hypothetical protein
MTAEPTGHVMWAPDPIKQRLARYPLEDVHSLPDDAPRIELRDGVLADRVAQDPLHPFADELVDGTYRLIADSTDELVPSSPFEIRLPIRDITP